MVEAIEDVYKKDEPTGDICEIFSSIQGEGIFVGHRQLFIRLAGCNLRCKYCDTKKSWDVPDKFRVEYPPSSRVFTEYDNPVSVTGVLKILERFRSNYIHHSISITGGEPLMQAGFLKGLLPALREMGFAVHLETNGVLYEHLPQLGQMLDAVSMDVKLPCVTGLPPMWDEHRKFIDEFAGSAHYTTELFVKVVVNERTSDEELARACRVVCDNNYHIPFVIQPETGKDGVLRVDGRRLVEMQDLVMRMCRLNEVRVIPQVHKFIDRII